MATRGMKPVAEIQFFDYIWPAMMQLRNEAFAVRWRSNGAFKAPAVIRVAAGGYLTGVVFTTASQGSPVHAHAGNTRVIAVDRARSLRFASHSDSLR